MSRCVALLCLALATDVLLIKPEDAFSPSFKAVWVVRETMAVDQWADTCF